MDKLRIYMAPMQGFTDAPLRNGLDKHFGGISAYYTPFVRWEHGGVRKRDLRELSPEVNHVACLVPQVMAGSADEADAILACLGGRGYTMFDLNMGCAFPVVARKGKGCGILPYPERGEDLLRIADRHPEWSFSVKMRLGHESPDECMALLPALNACRLSRIVVHARLGCQQYRGDCDRRAFERFARECSHPVVYNGDIVSVHQIEELREDMPFLDGVMLGRGLLAAPWLAAEYAEGKAWSCEKRLSALRALHDGLLADYGERLEGGECQLLAKMQSFWDYLYPDGDRKLRKKVRKARCMSDYGQAVGRLLQTCG